MSAMVKLFYNAYLHTLFIHPAAPAPSLSISKLLQESVKEERMVALPYCNAGSELCCPCESPSLVNLIPFTCRGVFFALKALCIERKSNRGAHSSLYILGQGKLDAGVAAVLANLSVWTMLLSKEGSQIDQTSQSSRATMLPDHQTTPSLEKPVLILCEKKRVWKCWLCPPPFPGSKAISHTCKLQTSVNELPILVQTQHYCFSVPTLNFSKCKSTLNVSETLKLSHQRTRIKWS